MQRQCVSVSMCACTQAAHVCLYALTPLSCLGSTTQSAACVGGSPISLNGVGEPRQGGSQSAATRAGEAVGRVWWACSARVRACVRACARVSRAAASMRCTGMCAVHLAAALEVETVCQGVCASRGWGVCSERACMLSRLAAASQAKQRGQRSLAAWHPWHGQQLHVTRCIGCVCVCVCVCVCPAAALVVACNCCATAHREHEQQHWPATSPLVRTLRGALCEMTCMGDGCCCGACVTCRSVPVGTQGGCCGARCAPPWLACTR
jgi:hypothetical protein